MARYKTLIILVFFVHFIAPSFAASTFPDIRSPRLQNAVSFLSEKGVLSGYPDGRFKPEKTINRAEALKMIFQSLDQTALEIPETPPFPDVSEKSWYAPHIAAAKKIALIAGYADGVFRPEQDVNRVEFVKMAMLAQPFYVPAKSPEMARSQYADLEKNAWYIPYLAFGLEYGFLEKTKKFKPDMGMTRGDAAIMIAGLLSYRENLPLDAQKKIKTTVLSCETCIRGINLGKEFPELAFHPLTTFEDGKLLVNGSDFTNYAFKKINVTNIILWGENDHLKQTTSEEEKARIIDTQYPDVYQRILEIHDGVQYRKMKDEKGQDYGMFEYSSLLGNKIKVRGGMDIFGCRNAPDQCSIEADLISRYNSYDYPGHVNINMTFDEYRRTQKAKADMFNIIKDQEYGKAFIHH